MKIKVCSTPELSNPQKPSLSLATELRENLNYGTIQDVFETNTYISWIGWNNFNITQLIYKQVTAPTFDDYMFSGFWV